MNAVMRWLIDPFRLGLIESKLDGLVHAVRHLTQEIVKMNAELQALETQVKANTDAEASAVLLLNKLSVMITACGTDPAKLKELSAQLAASSDSLGAAVTANTPAEEA